MSDRKSLLNKRRRRSIIAFDMIRLDRTAAEPLYEQLYRQIRDELRSGTFTDGTSRLPSSRALAVDLGISRLTVNLAFSKLYAEGYLRSKARSGTFVAHPLPETFLTADQPKACRLVEQRPRISGRARAIPDQRVGKQFDLGALDAGAGVSLVPGLPAVDEFPIDVWERLRSQVLAQKGAHLLRQVRADAQRAVIPRLFLGVFALIDSIFSASQTQPNGYWRCPRQRAASIFTVCLRSSR
jgi:DNA-binding transcriptional regulator YhcF (GntR family)